MSSSPIHLPCFLSTFVLPCFYVPRLVSVLKSVYQVFECPKDPSRAWAPTFPQGCNDLVVVYYAMASFNILSDIVILLLPLPSLMKLQVNKRKRGELIVRDHATGI